MRAGWEDARYGFTKRRLASWLELTVGWATTGGGYEWSTSVGVRGAKKHSDAEDAQIAAEKWARKALAEAAANLDAKEPDHAR